MVIKMKLSLKEIIKIDYYRNFGTEFKVIKFFFNKKARLLILFRILQCFYKIKKINFLLKIVRKVLRLYYNKLQFEFKIEILPETQIKEGLYLPHPQNIIINPNTIIGKNCTILQDVTIGNNNYKGLNNLAILGDSISIGAETKIIGPVIIGSNTIIGANSVVVKSFENPNQIIAGNPAKLIRKEANMYVHNQYLREKNE